MAAAAIGCRGWRKHKVPQSDPIPPSTQYSETDPIPVVPQDQPVKTGQPPLTYLMEHPGELRIVDATEGIVLISTRAGGRTIVTVDAQRGVQIGGKTIRPGPLNPTHQYEILLISPSENVRKNVYQRR